MKLATICMVVLAGQALGLAAHAAHIWDLIILPTIFSHLYAPGAVFLGAFVVLFSAVICGDILLYIFAKRTRDLETKMLAATGRFHDLIMDQFRNWNLSEAEREIGLLLIKGMSISEIASLRDRSVATIKAQNSSIYKKSGLNNRAQLVSYFVDELTSGL